MDWSHRACSRFYLFAITLCLVSSMPLVASAQHDAEASLGELVREFCSRYERRDLEALMLLWSDASPQRAANKENLQKVFASKSRITLADRSIRKTEIDGASAVVRVRVDQTGVDPKLVNGASQQSRTNWTFRCVLEDGRWRIWKQSSSEEELAADLVEATTDAQTNALLDGDAELVTSELLDVLNEIGRGFSNRGQFAKAINVFGIALRVAERLGDKKQMARALNSIGESYRNQNKSEEALTYQQQNLKLSEEIGDKPSIVVALASLGNIHAVQNNNALALGYYEKSLKVAEENGIKPGSMRALYNIGRIYDLQGKTAEALDYYQRSLKTAEEIDYKAGVAMILNGIGIIFRGQGKYPEALANYQRSLKLAEETGDRKSVCGALNNIGVIHKMQGRSDEALNTDSSIAHRLLQSVQSRRH